MTGIGRGSGKRPVSIPVQDVAQVGNGGDLSSFRILDREAEVRLGLPASLTVVNVEA
jgi:hypothetical protein